MKNENYNTYNEWCKRQKKKTRFSPLLNIKNCYSIYRSGLFDGNWYLNSYEDVREASINNPLWKLRMSKSKICRYIGRISTMAVYHYVKYGVYEGRNPNGTFNTTFYINSNSHIFKEKKINPFVHYIKYGIKEDVKENSLKELDTKNIFEEYTVQKIENNIHFKKIGIIINSEASIEELKRKLDFVQSQDYKNKSILYIDNKKNSQEILKYIKLYNKKNNKNIQVLEYEKNDGYYFSKALDVLEADLIWIVSNYYTNNQSLLSRLAKYFNDENVKLAYISSVSDTKDEEQININTGFDEFNEVNNIMNFDINLDLALFNSPKGSKWFENKQWDFYSDNHIKEFMINQIIDSKFVRIDNYNIQAKEDKNNDKKNYDISEYYNAQVILKKLHNIDNNTLCNQYENIRTEYLYKTKRTVEEFEKEYNISEIVKIRKIPTIMISIASFTAGGGEIMPIRLANQINEMGYRVFVHNMNIQKTVMKVRNMLNPGITVIETNDIIEMKVIIKKFGIQIVNTHHQATQSFIAEVVKRNYEEMKYINHVATSHGMYENFTNKELDYILQLLKGGVDYWTYVADKNLPPLQNSKLFNSEAFFKVPNGMERPKVFSGCRKELGISEDSFVITVISRALEEKGWIEAIESVKLARKNANKDIQLILIGTGPIYDKLIKCNVEDFIHLLGYKDNPCDYYYMSDLCLLTSFYKSESAPLTIIEAMMSNTPVIASNIGDIKEMLTLNGEICGDVFDLDNGSIPINIVSEKIVNLVNDKEKYEIVKNLAIKKSCEFDISIVAEHYLDIFMKKYIDEKNNFSECLNKIKVSNLLLTNAEKKINTPKVSVIVPNYNHEKYLRTRLDCIYNQTYKNIEVILMDDCSKDRSREILKEYANKYPDITKVLFNEQNSGGVFYQWKKGIQNASGDICWIAESDDYCDLNFIEKLIPAFNDEKVKISYCKYMFVNSKGESNPYGFINYVGQLDDEKWRKSYTNDSNDEVEKYLGIKNTIPNASGALFRKDVNLELFNDPKWFNMKICGDWIFYLNIINGGKVSYSVETQSYFRFHDNNSSAKTYVRDTYYKEHEQVAIEIKNLYKVNNETILKNYNIVKEFYYRNVKRDENSFKKLYNLEKII